jgi:hypothetical protein
VRGPLAHTEPSLWRLRSADLDPTTTTAEAGFVFGEGWPGDQVTAGVWVMAGDVRAIPATIGDGSPRGDRVVNYCRSGAGGTGMIRYQWFLIVAIAVGLIGMHHLVAEHGGHEGQSAHTTMIMTAGPGWSLMHPTPTEHSHARPAVNPVGARVAAISVLASYPCSCDPTDMVGHCCLAVLTAMTALTAVLILGTAWRRLWEPGCLLVGVGAVPARAPPSGSVRFLQLGVLRR